MIYKGQMLGCLGMVSATTSSRCNWIGTVLPLCAFKSTELIPQAYEWVFFSTCHHFVHIDENYCRLFWNVSPVLLTVTFTEEWTLGKVRWEKNRFVQLRSSIHENLFLNQTRIIFWTLQVQIYNCISFLFLTRNFCFFCIFGSRCAKKSCRRKDKDSQIQPKENKK